MNEEKRFISMLSDYGFKITFGNENHPKFLRKALQALIDSDIPIREVKFTKNEVTATTKDSRGGLFDITCENEKGQVFIVEMQLFDFSNMIHRAKFYAFHRFNIMVRKGKYRFNDLKKIYTITILAGKTYETALYHQIGTLKNQNGELMDDQITHVVVELEKFQKTLEEVETDLDKLLYTMKLTDTATKEIELPDFMKEDWLDETLKELDKANLTPEQRAELEIIIAGNMTEKVAREEEWKERENKIKEEWKERENRMKEEWNERENKVKEEWKERESKVKTEAVKNAIALATLSDEQIAKINDVTIEIVQRIREDMNGK